MPSHFPNGVLDRIYQCLDPRRLFQKFELADGGRRYRGRCPRCGKRELYVLKYDPRYPGLRARCNRLDKCGFSVSAWDYLREMEGVPQAGVLRTLAERAGLAREFSRAGAGFKEGLDEAWRRRERTAALHERFWNWAAERLWTEARHAASEEARTAAFLRERGYEEATARAMGLAFLPPTGQTRAFLLKDGAASEEDLEALPFLDRAFDRRNAEKKRLYTLAIPYPEAQSLVARTALPPEALPEDAPKYRYPRGLKLDAPAFLRSVDKRRPVVVVEGFLDAALAHALAAENSAGALPANEERGGQDARATKTAALPALPALSQLVATGTNRLNAAQIATLQGAGVRELILCFDTDGGGLSGAEMGAGTRGTLATLERLAEAGTFFPRVLRIPPELGCKDPDEVIARHGPEALARLLAEAAQGEAEFRAGLLLRAARNSGACRADILPAVPPPSRRHASQQEAGDANRAGGPSHGADSPSALAERETPADRTAVPPESVSEEASPPCAEPRRPGLDAVLSGLAGALEKEAARPARKLFIRELTTRVAGALLIPEEELSARLKPFLQRARRRGRAELLRACARAVHGALNGNGAETESAGENLARAEAALREGLERAAMLDETGAGAESGEALAPVDLAAYRAGLGERPERLESPYAKLDEAAAIHPGRITLIAARPSHGKTTFMLNLLVHWLKRYPERRFVFFSYDGPREQLLSQLLSRLTRRYALREIEESLRGEALAGGHPEADALAAKTKAALEWLARAGAQRRLFIVDRALTAGALCRAVRAIAATGPRPLGAVLVDYIQQVRPDRGGGRRFDSRQQEVGHVSRMLQGLAQETGVPVVAAAQLNRISESQNRTDRPRLWQLREAGDLEQDATTVYGLYNHHQAAAEAQPAEGLDGAGFAPAVGGTGFQPVRGNGKRRMVDGWEPGLKTPRPGRSNGNGSGRKGKRARRDGGNGGAELSTAPRPEVTSATALSAPSATRWVTPSALRSVALDVEVLKAKHGRTHARIALTYDLVANYITDGRTDGPGEL